MQGREISICKGREVWRSLGFQGVGFKLREGIIQDEAGGSPRGGWEYRLWKLAHSPGLRRQWGGRRGLNQRNEVFRPAFEKASAHPSFPPRALLMPAV